MPAFSYSYQPGYNVWAVAQASQLSFLIDTSAYFDAFVQAAELAEHSLFVLGWDIDSRTQLLPGTPQSEGFRLGTFLTRLAAKKPSLNIYLLGWDYAFIYTFEREKWPTFSFGLRSHHRVHYRLDNSHPMGASHHQKIIVVDNALAMVGGIDLSTRRYDTPDHLPHSTLRRDPDGVSYPPFHDVGVVLNGQVAQQLGELCRERWRTATRENIQAPPSSRLNKLPWPRTIKPDLTDLCVGIARTRAATPKLPQAIHEVQTLVIQSIQQARRLIYIEHQYVTSDAVAQALATSLHAPSGPEILIVGPQECSGWLEQNTMGLLRAEVFAMLHKANTSDRLRIVAPFAQDGTPINVHSKVLIVDDELCVLGSANLSNRSMQLDSECVVSVAAGNRQDLKRGMTLLRQRLMAEHLGVRTHEVESTFARTGSHLKTLDALNHGTRGLLAITPPKEPPYDVLPDKDLIDPKAPLELAYVLDRLIPPSFKSVRKQPLLRVAVALAFFLAIAAALRFTPLADLIPLAQLHQQAESYKFSIFALPITVAVFVFGNLALLPLTLLVVECGIIFGPVLGTLYALIAAMASASLVFWIGRATGQDVLKRFAQQRLPALVRPLGRRSFFVVAAIRLLPGAPFTIVNLVFGASCIQFRHFFLGSLIGMAPGIVTLTVFGGQLGQLLRAPSFLSAALALFIIAAVILAGRFLKRRFLTYAAPAVVETPAE